LDQVRTFSNRPHTATNYLSKTAQILVLLGFSVMQMWSVSVEALTGAGTVVNNTATASYLISGTPASTDASVAFTVQEVIDVSVSWTDGTNVIVFTPDTDQVSSFDIANTGNGSETFTLAAANVAGPTDEFDFNLVTEVAIYVEDGTTPGFQALEDTLYTGPGDNPTIAAESTLSVYLVADIQASLTDGDEGHLTISVDSTTAGAAGSAAGTSLVGLGDTGVDAIVGSSQANGSDTAIYQVSSVDVDLTEVIHAVLDPFGGTTFVPGSEVTYRITVTVTGGVAQALAIADPIPANTTYKDDTLFLDAVLLTDESDADSGDYNISQAGAVTVVLGNTPGGTVTTIDLTVTID
jgi:uncharacterized repeat protein (TIGR01451 family)